MASTAKEIIKRTKPGNDRASGRRLAMTLYVVVVSRERGYAGRNRVQVGWPLTVYKHMPLSSPDATYILGAHTQKKKTLLFY